MMEPVAWKWEDKTGAEWLCGDRDDAQQAAAIVGAVAEPLVRLSDAEARIAELEELAKAFEAEANQMREVSIKNRHRAEAAEALLKEAGPIIVNLMEIPCVRNDPHNDGLCRAARAIHHKIGVKDE